MYMCMYMHIMHVHSMYGGCSMRYEYGTQCSVSAAAGLIERKRVSSERREKGERQRRERLELEEAFRDKSKSAAIASEVRMCSGGKMPRFVCTCVYTVVYTCTCT